MSTAYTQAGPRILYTACPLCESENFRHLRNGECQNHPLYNPVVGKLMHWMRCGNPDCAHIFTDGYFTDEVAARIFSNTNEGQKLGHDMERQRPISARMVERVLPYHREGYWLDIGFGNGSLLFTADEYGFNCVGVDLRKNNVKGLQDAGFEAHCVDFQTLDHPARYAVISMADVLEHMPFPKQALLAANRLLGDSGVLLISMPNADSFLWQALNASSKNPYWGELEHYHNFGRRRLYQLLMECGFSPRQYGISERYRACMEVVALKVSHVSAPHE